MPDYFPNGINEVNGNIAFLTGGIPVAFSRMTDSNNKFVLVWDPLGIAPTEVMAVNGSTGALSFAGGLMMNSGQFLAPDGTPEAPAYSFINAPGAGLSMRLTDFDAVEPGVGMLPSLVFSLPLFGEAYDFFGITPFTGMTLPRGGGISWTPTESVTVDPLDIGTYPDVSLYRDGPGHMYLYSPFTPPQLSMYRRYYSVTDYDRMSIGWASSGDVFQIVPGAAGSGVAPTLRVVYGALPAITYSASMTPNAATGNYQTISATNGSAFTINAPANAATGQPLTITLRNTSGGALGTATWDVVFKMAAWTNPADTFSRSITFLYNGTNWIELSRTTADVPN